MKVAVVGKGTSSIITTLSLIKRGHEVTVFYDPNTKHINVGESTTPQFADLIQDVLGLTIHDMCDYNITSIKSGIKFINWGKGKSFKHNFSGNRIAFHFENKDLNPFIWSVLEDNNLVEFIPERVSEHKPLCDGVLINDKTFDFVVFCSGWANTDRYVDPFFKTVNTALLYAKKSLDLDNLHTIHRATEDGWEFGLPFPQRGVTKCGYLYDRNISNYSEVISKLEGNEIYEKYEWTPRYATKIIQNEHCAFNGNRLFFLEPLQAMSLYYTIIFSDYICDYLENKTIDNLHKTNVLYEYTMWEYQLSIAYHYNFGSVFKTKFWNDIKEKAFPILESFPKTNSKNILRNLVSDIYFRNKTNYCKIGCFIAQDVKQIHCGMLEDNFERIVNTYKESYLV